MNDHWLRHRVAWGQNAKPGSGLLLGVDHLGEGATLLALSQSGRTQLALPKLAEVLILYCATKI